MTPSAVPGFAAVPNEIIEHIGAFTPPELAFLLLMFRRETALQSLRWAPAGEEPKAGTKVPDHQWRSATGYSLRTKNKAVFELLKKLLVIGTGENDCTLYGVDWHAWTRYKQEHRL